MSELQDVADEIDVNGEDVVMSPLVAAIWTQMAADTAYTTNALMESYRSEIATLRATLAAVRGETDRLLSGQWMPSGDVLRSALWPSRAAVDFYREETVEQ